MRIKRNNLVSANTGSVAHSPTMRISQGVLRQQQEIVESERKLATNLSNSAMILTAGLKAGLTGQTTEDTGKMVAQGLDPTQVDMGGFKIGKFAQEVADIARPKELVRNPITGELEKSKKMATTPITKMEDFDFVKAYADSYNKGIQIGNATVNLQAKASITDAKKMAEESFQKDMISGNYNGAVERAQEAMNSSFEQYVSDENIAPAVKESIVKYQKSELANAQFQREYSVKLTNAIAQRNYKNAMTEIDTDIKNSISSGDLQKTLKLGVDKLNEYSQQGVVVLNDTEVKTSLQGFAHTWVKGTLDSQTSTVEQQESSLKQIMATDDSVIPQADKIVYKKQFFAKKVQTQARSENELKLDIANALNGGNGAPKVSEVSKRIDNAFAVKDLTEAQSIYLHNRLEPKVRTRPMTPDEVLKKSGDALEEWVKKGVLSLSEKDTNTGYRHNFAYVSEVKKQLRQGKISAKKADTIINWIDKKLKPDTTYNRFSDEISNANIKCDIYDNVTDTTRNDIKTRIESNDKLNPQQKEELIKDIDDSKLSQETRLFKASDVTDVRRLKEALIGGTLDGKVLSANDRKDIYNRMSNIVAHTTGAPTVARNNMKSAVNEAYLYLYPQSGLDAQRSRTISEHFSAVMNDLVYKKKAYKAPYAKFKGDTSAIVSSLYQVRKEVMSEMYKELGTVNSGDINARNKIYDKYTGKGGILWKKMTDEVVIKSRQASVNADKMSMDNFRNLNVNYSKDAYFSNDYTKFIEMKWKQQQSKKGNE